MIPAPSSQHFFFRRLTGCHSSAEPCLFSSRREAVMTLSTGIGLLCVCLVYGASQISYILSILSGGKKSLYISVKASG